jgi:hypothetical protein
VPHQQHRRKLIAGQLSDLFKVPALRQPGIHFMEKFLSHILHAWLECTWVDVSLLRETKDLRPVGPFSEGEMPHIVSRVVAFASL